MNVGGPRQVSTDLKQWDTLLIVRVAPVTEIVRRFEALINLSLVNTLQILKVVILKISVQVDLAISVVAG